MSWIVDNLNWILPGLLLIAGLPHLVRAVRANPWRFLLVLLLVALGAAQILLTEGIFQRRLRSSAIEVSAWAGYVGLLTFIGLIFAARGFRIFAVGIACLFIFWNNHRVVPDPRMSINDTGGGDYVGIAAVDPMGERPVSALRKAGITAVAFGSTAYVVQVRRADVKAAIRVLAEDSKRRNYSVKFVESP